MRVPPLDASRLSALNITLPGFTQESQVFDQQFSFSTDHFSSSHQSNFIGVRYLSEDESEVVQFKVDGMTFSRLEPYTSWEDTLSKVRELWQIYLTAVKPDTVTRIATRTVNELVLPGPSASLAQFLTAPPTLPDGLPTTATGFLSRVLISDSSSKLKISITQASNEKKGSNAKTLSMILDIDVFGKRELEPDSDELWTELAACRELRNRAFFSSITDQMLEKLK